MPCPRFSLRTLLVVVTVAGIAAWYLRPGPIQIIGDISRSDVAAICKYVDSTGPHEPIQAIKLLSPDQVEVRFRDEMHGHLEGGGDTVTLEKMNGAWFVTGGSSWVY
jgi:hypothetical protein